MKANFRMGTSVALFLLGGIMVSALVACDLLPFMGTDDDTTTSEDVTTTAPAVLDDSTTTEPPEEETTTGLADVMGLDVEMSDLEEMMQPIFAGNTVKSETVMFLDKGESKALLYPIDKIISVTSYNGKRVYQEGRDYVVENGKLVVPSSSIIPCITSSQFYGAPTNALQTVDPNGEVKNTHWGEGTAMTAWQVCVNYTHTTEWEGYTQPCELETYQNFVKKLIAGEDVTVFFYGDSITYGATSSYLSDYAPHQWSYPMLFTKALADLFDYTIHFAQPNLNAGTMTTCRVPNEDYVAGTRGTITYVNTAIGGWTSGQGVSNFDGFVKSQIELYGCDLFVLGFGMNDGSNNPMSTVRNLEDMVDGVLALAPDTSVVLVSTMVPNPKSIGWFGNQDKQEARILTLAEDYRKEGVSCGVSCMTSVSLAVLEHKVFHDYSGNNINHPNDYFGRIYAQTLLQDVIGYENMK